MLYSLRAFLIDTPLISSDVITHVISNFDTSNQNASSQSKGLEISMGQFVGDQAEQPAVDSFRFAATSRSHSDGLSSLEKNLNF